MKSPLHLSTFIVFVCLAILFQAPNAIACPTIRGLVDFNCDGVIKIAVAGDSIVYGRGDLDNENRGGWVKRLGPLLRVPAVRNIGVPGISSEDLYQRLLKNFKKPSSSIYERAIDADIFIIGVGANDFYAHGDPSLTVRNIKRIVSMVRKELGRGNSVPPYVLVAKLTPTTRGFQRSFMENVNILLARYRSNDLPSYLRFDVMHEDYVSYDGLHPISSGYEELSQIAADYLKGDATRAMKSARKDVDKDGVYDMFERSRYTTNPSLRDTDGDGLPDGKEIFTWSTDPNVADSDGDGQSDGAEITANTDPLDPLQF